MLQDLWRFIKSFKMRFVIYYLVVLTLTLFGTIPVLAVKLLLFTVFLAASVLFVPIISSMFVSTIRQFQAYRNRVDIPISKEITLLSEKAGIQLKSLGIVKGRTAFVLRNSLILGKDLLQKLSFDERQAVVAHELGHIKGQRKHTLFRLFWIVSLLAVVLFSWSKLYSPIFFSESITQIILTVMVNIALLAFMTIVMIPINWYIELDADRFAKELVGKEHIRSALLKLTDEKGFSEPSETHPSIEERVKRLDK
jgi:Zn-dependent protease with chaperone function